MSGPIFAEALREGAVERIVLARPPANILDTAMVEAIGAHLATLARPQLRLVLFDSEGPQFSFGASVEEHLPGRVDTMLPTFHRLFEHIEALGVPTAAAVRGRALGGAAELVVWCGRVFCTPESVLGFPEIRLAVFPPVAAMALRWRTSGATGTRLVLTGESVRGPEAVAMGLTDALAEDPTAAALAWYDAALAPLSPVALRVAWRAARTPLSRALREELPALERLYLDELMAHPDAEEGLRAFVQRRQPVWRQS